MSVSPGDILRVRLEATTAHPERTANPSASGFPGGRGRAVMELLPYAHLPFDHPDMPLCLFGGPLSGTTVPLCGRSIVAAISPLTGTVFDAQAGGRLAFALAGSGLAGVVVAGRADVPSGLEIVDGQAVLRPCPDWTALGATDIAARLRFPGEVLRTGPAAWTGAALAGVVAGRPGHVLRGGLGLCLAAKNLVYVAVSGSRAVHVADAAGLSLARADLMRLTAASPALAGAHGLSRFGTAALMDLTDSLGMTPTQNFRATRFPGQKAVNAPALARGYAPRRTGCRACHLPCGRMAADGTPLPDLDALSHFTALVDNPDLKTAVAANARCIDLGLDPVSAASVLACHAEISGEPLSPSRLLALVDDMGHGRGLGRELARGAAAYARGAGLPGAAMAVKGLELGAFDPRGAYGLALSYAVSTRGGCHLRAFGISHEVLRKPVATDRFDFAGKARILFQAENVLAALDSLVACPYLTLAASLEELAPALCAATGHPADPGEMARAGERVVYAERIINARRGFAVDQDDLPARFFTEPGTPGEDFAVPPIDRAAFLAARAAYYRIRGLTAAGLPRADTARELGLAWTG
ncbi:aldehyde ferredoxin oxidoreductase [Desulfovibrio sulfodismutans]|uniref:Aldehyde ferredoxin oxidoreductase n=1 Tax=Desulfolutivibrio sulfodismutans TaxID=63561 RepID=A0A7K3NNJ3_9BACT|nr:aldehyde ferredoxin oxidoreductase C-terminal domain-containing protein [Desulfolutivibrio sulfodismutans]NDY57764.1 aldehyde ferredoxin oxidoreductase [Desulfolutivibrio sulfodismutans]QLA13348.1 aldehyde ferredoxin oxidoreductase [Desulfolutivibrio sulfodismutans DSM 3696]